MEEKVQCRCELDDELEQVLDLHKGKKEDLIEVLYWVQSRYGYIPRDVQFKIAEKLDVEISAINGVVTFYSLFSLKPKGKYQISICKGTACYVRGSNKILDRFKKELGINTKDTTDDRKFSLDMVRCMGACGLAPVITINGESRTRMKANLVPEIINELKNLDN